MRLRSSHCVFAHPIGFQESGNRVCLLFGDPTHWFPLWFPNEKPATHLGWLIPFPFFSTVVLFESRSLFPRGFWRFPKDFLERMELEATSTKGTNSQKKKPNPQRSNWVDASPLARFAGCGGRSAADASLHRGAESDKNYAERLTRFSRA